MDASSAVALLGTALQGMVISCSVHTYKCCDGVGEGLHVRACVKCFTVPLPPALLQ